MSLKLNVSVQNHSILMRDICHSKLNNCDFNEIKIKMNDVKSYGPSPFSNSKITFKEPLTSTHNLNFNLLFNGLN